MIPDAVVTDTASEILKAGPFAALCLILIAAIWWLDKRAREDAKASQAALDKANADHLATLQKTNDRSEHIARSMDALTQQISILANTVGMMKERDK